MLAGVRREDHCEILYRGMSTVGVRRMASDFPRRSRLPRGGLYSGSRSVPRTDALSGYAERLNGTAVQVLKRPRDLTTIRSDKSWGAANGIDWSAAIITMIPLRV